jgi:alkylhydroperoxidase family enzyme
MLRDVCGDEATMHALCREAAGVREGDGGLDDTDRAVVAFARKVARRAPDVDASDIAALRDAGLSDADIADLIFAVAARCFFATAVDAAGIAADAALAAALGADAMEVLTVGRAVAT